MHLNARSNDYQRLFPDFDKTPKAVIAAICYSLAMRLNDDSHQDAYRMIKDEWLALYEAQIVPQMPLGYRKRSAPNW